MLIVATAAHLRFRPSRANAQASAEVQPMLADMELDTTPDEKRYNAKLFTIAGDEPMPVRALDALAYNAGLDATASDNPSNSPPW
ncbi:hypothetical protein Q3C01_16175 [Bradyrhizobium sp. UFLA05-109]